MWRGVCRHRQVSQIQQQGDTFGTAGRDLDAAGITDPRLRASYERCRELNAQHGKTYYLATLLLPPAKRPYVHALYGFARYADEIVDDLASTLTEQEKAEWLGGWGQAFLDDVDRGWSDDPVCMAVVDTVLQKSEELAKLNTELEGDVYVTMVVEKGPAMSGDVAEVPCHHHQAIDRLGEGLRVIARAELGHVEAFAIENGGWAYGVQWHPEDNAASDKHQAELFGRFVRVAAASKPIA